MASSSKKRQTMAKMNRERAVREKRALKAEKKAEKAAAKLLAASGEAPAAADEDADEDTPPPDTEREVPPAA
jgi:hypothetical protein